MSNHLFSHDYGNTGLGIVAARWFMRFLGPVVI
jgi:hypothetical protein